MARSKISFLRASALVLIAGGFTVLASSAQAGFDFTAPPKPVVAPAPGKDTLTPDMPVMPAMPSDKVDASDLNKLPVVDAPAAIDPNPMANPVIAAPLPPVITETPTAPAPATLAVTLSAPVATSNSQYEVAQGFGSDIPLALAMRQIVPAQYAFAFDPAIDKGSKISWNGGKAWDEVLNDSLKPVGYAASVSGNTVRVLPLGKVAATVPVVATPIAVAEIKAVDVATVKSVPTAEDVTAASAPDTAKAPVHEVYVRRSAAEKESAAHTPAPPEHGKPAMVSDENSVTLKPATDQKEEKSFWAKANPANWGESTAPATGDNDDKVVATAPVAKIEAKPASEPILLTRGPGEVSPAVSNTEKVEAKIQQESRMAEGNVGVKAAPVEPNATAVAMDPATVTFWEAKEGDSLKDVLQAWSAIAKVQLYWVPAQDYKLPKAVRLQGSYTDAVASALGAYDDKKSRPVGRLHPNLPNGPAVLIIEPSSVSAPASAS